MEFDARPQPWTPDDVDSLEKRVSHRLPEDYRRHLLSIGSGPLPRRIVPGTGDNAIVHTLLGYHDFLTLLDSESSYYELIPDRYLPVVGGEGGAVLIGLTEPVVGQVFWADYDKAEQLGLTAQLDETDSPESSEEIVDHRYDSWGHFAVDIDAWELV
jgi:hypothetical protein